MNWTLLGVTVNYFYWQNQESDGTKFYNVTSDNVPPLNNGGYYNLFSLQQLKNDYLTFMELPAKS